MTESNICILLAARPSGVPEPRHFRIEARPVREPGPGEVVVAAAYWSVDPAMRGWVNAAANYARPVPLGGVMKGDIAGTVIASRAPGLAEGDRVAGRVGWQTRPTVNADDLRRVEEADLPLSFALGPLGMPGLTAYFGLLVAGAPRPGETVVVSSAAGAVGSAVGQIARIAGCRTVGIAGGARKLALCREEFGFDAAIDHRAPGLSEVLAAACPDGVDVHFDNVCGPVSDAVMARLAIGARVVVCGTAAITEWDPPPPGPRLHRQLLVARARMQGFLVSDHRADYATARHRLAGWLRDGRLRVREHVLEGAQAAPGAIAMLYSGANLGKLLIRISE